MKNGIWRVLALAVLLGGCGGLDTVSDDRLFPARKAGEPQTAAAFIERGAESAEQGGYEQAIADFTEAIRLDPGNASAYRSRGEAYQNKGFHDLNRAILDCDDLAGLDFNGAWEDDCDRAIEDFTEAIRLDPNDALAYRSRGWAYTWKRGYEQAIADFTEALRLEPESYWAADSAGEGIERVQ